MSTIEELQKLSEREMDDAGYRALGTDSES